MQVTSFLQLLVTRTLWTAEEESSDAERKEEQLENEDWDVGVVREALGRIRSRS